MRGFECRWTRTAVRPHLGWIELLIASTPEAAEDLAADRAVPVPEGVPYSARSRGPRTSTEHPVIAAEDCFAVLLVRKAFEARVRLQIAGGPLPDVADHAATSHGRQILRVAPYGRCSE